MKKHYLLIFAACLLASCGKESDGLLERNSMPPEPEVQSWSGTINADNLPYTVKVGGKTIRFVNGPSAESAPMPQTKALQLVKKGPFQVSAEDVRKAFSNEKVFIGSYPGIISGIYICDVYRFAGVITMPQNAISATIEAADPCGYSDFGHQVKGINWSMATDPSGNLSISYNYYTITVNYALSGAYFGGRVIPVDGNSVSVPYSYYVEEDIPLKEPTMDISINTLTGKTLAFKVDKNITVGGLKGAIQDREGIPPDQQKLIFAGKKLDNDNTPIVDYGVYDGATLHLILKLRGEE